METQYHISNMCISYKKKQTLRPTEQQKRSALKFRQTLLPRRFQSINQTSTNNNRRRLAGAWAHLDKEVGPDQVEDLEGAQQTVEDVVGGEHLMAINQTLVCVITAKLLCWVFEFSYWNVLVLRLMKKSNMVSS